MTLPNGLSKREQEVVDLILAGKSNKQIASALGITERTVEFHLTNIYTRYQVSSRTELILKLRESTVVSRGEESENRANSVLAGWTKTVQDRLAHFWKEPNMQSGLNADERSSEEPMTMLAAIRRCFIRYADFQGRASRPEFWWFALFVLLVAAALAQLHENAAAIFLIAVLVPFLAAGARRLRDTGQSPWMLLYLLVPVGGIIVLGYYWAQPAIVSQPLDTGPA